MKIPRAHAPPKTTIAEERALAEKAMAKLSAADKRKAKLLLRPAIRIYTKHATDVPVGTSRFGGTPDLPAGMKWPTRGKTPLTFLAQLRLDELRPFDPDHVFPERGLLSIFLDEHGYEEARVLHVDAPALARAAVPKKHRPFDLATVRFHTAFELPGPNDTSPLAQVDLPRPKTRSQLLGWDGHFGYQKPLPANTRLLFRCESDQQANMNFGDAQDLHIRIADKDLAAGKLDRVTVWFQ
jgi:uncharacterized protein YwqG